MGKAVVIIGGGITGLAAAHRLQSLAPDLTVTLIERDNRLGGKIVTERFEGFIIEGAPDSFLSRKPRGVGLCEELALTGRLQGRQPDNARTYVRYQETLHRLPEGLTGMVPTNLDALARSTLISAAGRARLQQELTLPPVEAEGDESIAHFISRRLGPEVYERLVEPLMGGIYAGDGTQLSLAATFPHLRQLELTHGSLIKGLLAGRQDSPAVSPYPPFLSFKGGMGELVEALVARLTETTIVTGVGIEGVQKKDGRYLVLQEDDGRQTADAVIVTTPAYVTANLMAAIDPVLVQAHAAIPHASSATVTLVYRAEEMAQSVNGYGYVIPRAEETDVLACTWTSSKWAERVPAGYQMLRVYLGRYGRRNVLQDSDAALVAMAQAELRQTMQITAEPLFHRVYRWPQGMPQYTMGHRQRLAQIEARLAQHPGLFVAGAAYRGVGIPDCILSGETAAEAVCHYLRERVGQGM